MYKLAISSDSSAALPPQIAETSQIHVMPLNVIVDGVEYLDGVNISPEILKVKMRQGADIKTSTPAYAAMVTYFENLFKLGYEEVIHFTISSKLSSIYSMFTTYCKETYGSKVTIIDSYSVAAFMGNHVLLAAALRNQGKSRDAIIQRVQERIGTEQVFFIPESLTFLRRGGRVSPAVALVGNLMGVKPLLTLKDGAVEKVGTVRTHRQGIHQFLELIKEKGVDPNTHELVFLEFDSMSLINSLQGDVAAAFPGVSLSIHPLAINICAHVGPGTVAIGLHKKPI